MSEKISRLVSKIKFSDQPRLVNLVKEEILPQNLKELKSHCSSDQKLAYIDLYIKSQSPITNFLIFVNTINNGKKLVSQLTLLGHRVTCLHSKQQQKQRFKKLEQFKSRKVKVVIATDVIARGIDLPTVGHVIHYNLSKDAETYIHRCGRTARMRSTGCSYALISPEEMKNYLNICMKLKKEKGIDDFGAKKSEIDGQSKLSNFSSLMFKVELIRSLGKWEKNMYQVDKKKKEVEWIKKVADNCGIVINDEMQREVNQLEGEISRKRIKVKNLKNTFHSIKQV